MVMLKEKLRKESGALAKARAVRSSARKLNLVAASIRGKAAAAALTQLRFRKAPHRTGSAKRFCRQRSPTPKTITASMSTSFMSPKPGSDAVL